MLSATEMMERLVSAVEYMGEDAVNNACRYIDDEEYTYEKRIQPLCIVGVAACDILTNLLRDVGDQTFLEDFNFRSIEAGCFYGAGFSKGAIDVASAAQVIQDGRADNRDRTWGAALQRAWQTYNWIEENES